MTKWIAESVNIGSSLCCRQSRGQEALTGAPGEMGSPVSGALAPELLVPALANSVGALVALLCEARGIPYQGIRLKVEAEVTEGDHLLESFRLSVQVPGNLENAGRGIAETAENLFQASSTLAHGANVEIIQSSGEGA